jgi:hypothetical protein
MLHTRKEQMEASDASWTYSTNSGEMSWDRMQITKVCVPTPLKKLMNFVTP